MNKNLRNNIILVTILLLLIVIKVLNDRSNYTPSDKIFKGNKDLINKFSSVSDDLFGIETSILYFFRDLSSLIIGKKLGQ